MSEQEIEVGQMSDEDKFFGVRTKIGGQQEEFVEEAEAVELFPAQSRIWNTANQYHLFVMKDNVRIPIGFDFGGPVELKENGPNEFGAKQTYQSTKPNNG